MMIETETTPALQELDADCKVEAQKLMTDGLTDSASILEAASRMEAVRQPAYAVDVIAELWSTNPERVRLLEDGIAERGWSYESHCQLLTQWEAYGRIMAEIAKAFKHQLN